MGSRKNSGHLKIWECGNMGMMSLSATENKTQFMNMMCSSSQMGRVNLFKVTFYLHTLLCSFGYNGGYLHNLNVKLRIVF